jgi:hypothetical protein
VPQDYFQEMLCWIACARRPLSLGELETVLSTLARDFDEQPLDDTAESDNMDTSDSESVWNDWPDFETDLRTTFGSFMTLTRADGKTTEVLQSELNKNQSGDQSTDENPLEHSICFDEASDGEELVALPEFRSNRQTTIVQFSHASIRDFLFRNEAILPQYYRIDSIRANANIATRILAYFADDATIDSNKAPLYTYSADHWLDHLNDVDQTKLPLENRIRVLKLLFRIFHDPTRAYAFFERRIQYHMESFRRMSQTLLSIVNEWNSEDVQRGLSDDERVWISQARTSTSNLFRCVGREVCSEWLTSWEFLHPHYFHYTIEFLHKCSFIVSHPSLHDSLLSILPGNAIYWWKPGQILTFRSNVAWQDKTNNIYRKTIAHLLLKAEQPHSGGPYIHQRQLESSLKPLAMRKIQDGTHVSVGHFIYMSIWMPPPMNSVVL